MSEGDLGPSDAGGGGSFWTSLPALLTASAVLLGAIVSAVVALRDDDGSSATPPATTTTPAEQRYFTAVTRPTGRVYFEEGTMFMKASRPGRPMLALAELDEPLADVRLSARAEWVSGARDHGVGFVCRYANADSYYLLAVLSDGRYHVVRYRGGRPISLTGGIQTSGAVEADANDVEARCVGDDPVTLTLRVNGREVARVRDGDGIAEGNVGIRLGTSESVVTYSIEGFALSSL
ncbi:MAG: hypothetical protein ACRDNB_09765 [Gaiellaceae bacterium]